MVRTVSIRQSLLRNLTAIVLVLGLAILAMTFVGGRNATRGFSQALIDQTLSRTEAHLSGFFDPVERQLELLREWGEAGRLDLDDPHGLNEILGGFMRRHPWVTSCMVADDTGREHLLLRAGDDWQSRQTLDPDGTRRVIWRDWSAESPSPTETVETLDYDPRTRPWFGGAGPGEPYWTEAYTFFTTKEPGITASVAYARGGHDFVIGLDVLLLDISRFTGNLQVSEGGTAFVLDERTRIIGLPRTQKQPDPESLKLALLQRPDDLDAPLVREMAGALIDDDLTGSAERFRVQGSAWWGQLSRFDLATERPLYIGVAVPEADLLGDVTRQRLWIALLTALVIGIAIARASRLATGYSKPLERLVAESERIATGDLEAGEPISTHVEEVRRLAQAHGEMRKGLGTLLKIEQDLRVARRIQMSTFPERLPALPGFDLAAWSEPADETGGDSYDVIGLRHASSAERIVLDDENAGRAILLLADATGHGIGPALSVTQVRAMLRVAVRMSLDLSQIVTHINRQLCDDLPSSRFVTAWFGDIDAESGKLRAVSAGQAPILHYHAATDSFDVMSSDAMPLGLFDRGPITIPDPIDLEPGDIYAAISDGIFEAANRNEEMFGEERVQQIIRTHREASAEELLGQLRGQTEAFTEGLPPDDDRTIILIKRS
ncbi:MAG: SpoIIE family protein phosphatase [bacterium]|nr:SpoIIE family protein phosphatase [bacterium]